MTGLLTHPTTTLVERVHGVLRTGPQPSAMLCRDVLGLSSAPLVICDRIAVALLGSDPRIRRLSDGRWGLVPEVQDSPLLDECAFAVVDVETTGARATAGDRITEVAVVVVCGGRREVVFDSLVNPGRPIPPAICAITNITNDMVRSAPTFAEVADQVVAALAGRIFVAHNARFDWNFLAAEIRRASDLALDGPRLCTVRLARRLVKGITSCGLDSLTHWFGFTNPARHRAGGDALVTAELLGRLLVLARDEGARTLQDLAAIESRRAFRRPRRRRRAMPTAAAGRLGAGAARMTLARTMQVGGLRCHTLEAGGQWLDGGAMFGVVPYTLWTRRVQHDDRHRIPLAMRCLLVEHPDGLVLIDTGLGNKEDAKFLDIYGVENQGLEGATQLEDALAAAGHLPRDVRWVINTHLHFDHAGGNTTLDPELEDDPRRHVRATFPNATYVVQKGELEFARRANERTRASYLPHNFEPIAAAERWRLLEGDGEVLPGISVRLTPGHVPVPPDGPGAGPGRDPRVHRRPHPHHRAPAAPLDHGVRPGAAPDAGEQTGVPGGGRAGGVADRLRARPVDRRRHPGAGREGCGAAGCGPGPGGRRCRRCHPERSEGAVTRVMVPFTSLRVTILQR